MTLRMWLSNPSAGKFFQSSAVGMIIRLDSGRFKINHLTNLSLKSTLKIVTLGGV